MKTSTETNFSKADTKTKAKANTGGGLREIKEVDEEDDKIDWGLDD